MHTIMVAYTQVNRANVMFFSPFLCVRVRILCVNLVPLLKNFIANVLKCKARLRIKFKHVLLLCIH